MKAFLECVPCVINQIIRILRKRVNSLAEREKILKAVLQHLSKYSPSALTPPDLTFEAYRILKKYLGDEDFYLEEKKLSNKIGLELFPKIQKLIKNSKEPLHAALLLSIAGNIIDYGPGHQFDVNKTLKAVLKKRLSKEYFGRFKRKLKRSKLILYVCDNAGEIVFDRLLIELLEKSCGQKVVVAVKSRPVLNDALLRDAKIAGLNQIAEVIESGSVTAGTSLNQTSRYFQKVYKRADLVISKGQGNFETLPHNQKTFFLLMIKCPHLALATGLDFGEIVIWSKN